MQELRETRKNNFASNKDKTMRMAISMPAPLYFFLDKSFKMMYNEDLFNKEYDINWFMKHFGKYFAVPKER